MSQQKQQNSQSSKNVISIKRSQKSGFLVNKASLPPIKRSLSRQSQFKQVIVTPKKHKLSDIFYQSLNENKKITNNKIFSRIQAKTSHFIELQKQKKDGKQQNQNLIKINSESKINEEPQLLCKFHQKQMVTRLKTQSTQNSRCLQNHLTFIKKSKSILIPIKLKPIKINTYQKLQLFDGPKNRNIYQSRINNAKSYLTITQANQIAQKLSKPKCSINCKKKNCECNLDVNNNRKLKHKRYMTLQKLQKSQIKMSLEKLKYIQKNQQIQKGVKKQLNLRKIKQQRQISKKKYKVMPIKKQDQKNQNDVSESQSLKNKQQDLNNQNDYIEQDSFIKGIKNSQDTKKKCKNQYIQNLDKIQIQIQTENQFGNSHDEKIQTKINFKLSRKSNKRKTQSVNIQKEKKNSKESQNSQQAILQKIGYTFGDVKKQKEKKEIAQNKKYQNENWENKYHNQKITRKMNLKIEKTVDIKQIKQQNPQTLIQTLERMPINLSIVKLNNGQISQIGSTLLNSSRNCISSKSNKHYINMFNKQLKSLKQSRMNKRFTIPKQNQYVQFIKNYIPINPQIDLKKLIYQKKFKVIPDITSIFFGQFQQNKKNGLGIEIFFHQIFQGKFQQNKRKNGILKLHNGIYQGQFLNNLRHGQGKFKWDDGQIYEGQWKIGLKSGYGIWKAITGSQYQGQWLNNQQHGKGKHSHPSSTYEGQFKQSLKEGIGKQIFPNGDVFNGFYVKGKPNGPGKYIWADGTYYQGNFKNGQRDGYAKWHQSSQTLYQGFFMNDLKNGKGIQYYKDGSYLQGQFKNGAIVKGKLYDINNQLVQHIDKTLLINNKDKF